MGTLTQPLHIEERIHQAAQSKRVRINEFFKDFDRLRTGDITGMTLGWYLKYQTTFVL